MKKRFLNQQILIMALLLAMPLTNFAQHETNESFSSKTGIHSNPDNTKIPEERNPNNDRSAMWLHWDDGDNEDQWGFGFSAETFDLVSKWDPSHIAGYDGWTITKMRFIIISPTPVLTLKIWEGPATTEVYSQDIGTFSPGDWTEIVLTTPYVIDATTQLWAGLNIDMQFPDISLVATDNGPAEDEYGNLYRVNGTWYSDYNNQNVQIFIEPSLTAYFEADVTSLCYGNTVNYTDTSLLATSWNWTFEGGVPATSTDQNPSVVYNTPGYYDATLIVSDGSDYDTLVKTDYISVLETPVQADTPDGDTNVCNSGSYDYTTNSVLYATDYEWELSPPDAGTLTSDTNSATLQTDATWTGDFTIRVRATNMCGDGVWSDNLEGSLFAIPGVFNLSEGGEYCDGNTGIEITQDGSEVDIDYELFLDGTSTGTIIAGTGSSISYGIFTDEGDYTATGTNGVCYSDMGDTAVIIVNYVPEQASTPTGDTEVCAGTTTEYSVAPIEGSDTTLWSLTPPDAGIITVDEPDILIEWDADFEGIASLTAQGQNECGLGDESEALEINCSQTPTPEITGADSVCSETEEVYSTVENAGNDYNWTVTGGEIISGQGTYQITVQWDTVGDGTVDLTETVASTCEGTAETLEVSISPSPTPEITGLNMVCKETEEEYSTEENAGNTYAWAVSGGTISTGEGTYQITVLWGAVGSGTVDLTETNEGNCPGTAETFEVTIDECIGVAETGAGSLNIYPNPASSKINLESQTVIKSFKMYSITGEEVAKEDVFAKNYRINTSKFHSGIYLLVVETNEGIINKRIVIE